MGNHGLSIGIHLENRLTAGARHLEHTFRHKSIVNEIAAACSQKEQVREETIGRVFRGRLADFDAR
jgi:hypothetical protein